MIDSVMEQWEGESPEVTAKDPRNAVRHPKLDMKSGELFFVHQSKAEGVRELAFCTADKEGRVVDESRFPTPYAGTVGGFVVTEAHVVILLLPWAFGSGAAAGPLGQGALAPESHFAVLPRHGASADEVRWFHGPAAFAAQMMNGFDDGSKILVDLCLADCGYSPVSPHHLGGSGEQARASSLKRITFNLAGNGDTVQIETP